MISFFPRKGSGLIELIIAMGIFAAGIVAIVVIVFQSGTLVTRGTERTQATLLAQEGLEAVRSIRDLDFELLEDGTYGLELVGGVWELDATPDVTAGNFTRTITIETPTDITNAKRITSTVDWDAGPTQNLNVALVEDLTKWKRPPLTEIERFCVDLSDASIEQGSVNKIVRYIYIGNCSSVDITIDKMRLTWSNPTDFFKIKIGGQFTYQGRAVSGQELDMTNVLLPAGDTPDNLTTEIEQLRWYESIAGTDIDIEFIMSDGSSETFTIPAF